MNQTGLHEALQHLQALAVKGMEPKPLPVPHDRTKVRYVVNGEVQTFDVPPPARSHKLRTLVDLVQWAILECDHTDARIWRSEEGVKVIASDGSDREDRALFKLDLSEQFQTLKKLATAQAMTQAEFIKLLRFDLSGAWESYSPDLLRIVRSLKFEDRTSGSANRQHGVDTLGRTQYQAVTAEADIPETVVLAVSVHANPGESGFNQSVACGVDVDPCRGTFRLVPLPDELSNAESAAQANIAKRIVEQLAEADAEIAVFYGTP